MNLIKVWAKGLNFDPTWQKEIDDIDDITKLDLKVSNLIGEIGWANLQGLLDLLESKNGKQQVPS